MVIGGIIEVNYDNTKNILRIAFKDWDTKEVIREYITDTFNQFTENDIYFFLCDHSTPYYADMVWDYIERFWLLKINQISMN
jgi:hypothetical protein